MFYICQEGDPGAVYPLCMDNINYREEPGRRMWVSPAFRAARQGEQLSECGLIIALIYLLGVLLFVCH